jgi:hypothetical protein
MDTLNRRGVFDTTLRFIRIAGTALLAVCLGVTKAYADDDDGRHHQEYSHYAYGHDEDDNGRHSPIPPENDPSHLRDLVIEDLPGGLPDANEGTFEGGNTGTVHDAEQNNVLQVEDQRDDGTFENIEVHEMARIDGLMEMREVTGLVIPANGQIHFEPGGKHLMLMGPQKQLTAGQKVDMTLTFKSGRK